MSVKLIDRYVGELVTPADIEAIAPEVKKAAQVLESKTGEGNDFLGWLTLPTDYDKEEFARIKKAAAKIKSDSEVLIVIGIGGSYLGARAAIEFIKSPNYNVMKKDTPDIYFSGNSISSTALKELVIFVTDVIFQSTSFQSQAQQQSLQ